MLRSELLKLHQKKKETEEQLKGAFNVQKTTVRDHGQKKETKVMLLTEAKNREVEWTFEGCFPHCLPQQFQLCAHQEFQASITERLVQSEGLVFQEEALCTLHHLLTQDLRRYQKEIQRLTQFTEKIQQHSYRYPNTTQDLWYAHKLQKLKKKKSCIYHSIFSSEVEQNVIYRGGDCSVQRKSETEQHNNMVQFTSRHFLYTV